METTPESNGLYSTLYKLYVDHVKDEIIRLTQVENYSLTWAANNAITLVPFGLAGGIDGEAILPSELRDQMKSLPIYIVEKLGKRQNINFNDLAKEKTFWTVDCQLVRSAEQLVREAKSNSNVSDLVKALGDHAQELPDGTVLYNLDVSPALRDSVELEFEPHEVKASESLRRVDIKWSAREQEQWIRISDLLKRSRDVTSNQRDVRIVEYLEQRVRRSDGRRASFSGRSVGQLWLAHSSVPFKGIDGYSGIISYLRTFLRGDIAITSFLRDLALNVDDPNSLSRLHVFGTVFLAASETSQEQAITLANTQLRNIGSDLGEELIQGSEAFLEALRSSPLPSFDTSVWRNRNYDLSY